MKINFVFNDGEGVEIRLTLFSLGSKTLREYNGSIYALFATNFFFGFGALNQLKG